MASPGTSFVLKFMAHGFRGKVQVSYTLNEDPKHLGYDKLGMDVPPDMVGASLYSRRPLCTTATVISGRLVGYR